MGLGLWLWLGLGLRLRQGSKVTVGEVGGWGAPIADGDDLCGREVLDDVDELADRLRQGHLIRARAGVRVGARVRVGVGGLGLGLERVLLARGAASHTVRLERREQSRWG